MHNRSTLMVKIIITYKTSLTKQKEKQMKKAKDSKEYDTMLFEYIEKELGILKKETIKRNKKESKVLEK